MDRIKIMGIAPYENMRDQLLARAMLNPDIELTVFVGDMEEGVELARCNYYNEYDAIISRGGTAQLLRKEFKIPVIEIPVTALDIMSAIKLAENITNHYAVAGYSNVVDKVSSICKIMQITSDIYTISEDTPADVVLDRIRATGTQAILCDMTVYTAAARKGMDVVLIASGTESIQGAFDEARRSVRAFRNLRAQNTFFRKLLSYQSGATVVFDEHGNMLFSTVTNSASPIVEILRELIPNFPDGEEQTVIRRRNGLIFRIILRREIYDERVCVACFVNETNEALTDSSKGIRYLDRQDAAAQYEESIACIGGIFRYFSDKLRLYDKDGDAVIICGERGTMKEEAGEYVYLQSSLSSSPLVIIDCFMLDDLGWMHLTKDADSPLLLDEVTLFFENIDDLKESRRRELINLLITLNTDKRCRLIFSYTCPVGENTAPIAADFVEYLTCKQVYIEPVRNRANQIPAFANLFIGHINAAQTKHSFGFTQQAMRLMQSYDWPNNYVQLQRILRDLTSAEAGPYITEETANKIFERETKQTNASFTGTRYIPCSSDFLEGTLSEIERRIVTAVLKEEDGNQSKTAKRLGIGRTTLWRMINDENK